MKLLTLHLQAFGPFTDRVIELGSTGHSLLLIHGPNEAGKSAMLRAISDLRFGIPTQSKDNFVHAHPDMRVGGVFQDRAGHTHAFVRRKGRGHTLLMAQPGPPLVATDEPVPPELEAQLTGGLNKDDYELMFGLDHPRLRQGGEALLKGEGEVGAALFEASAGVRSIPAILERLDQGARKFFMPGARGKNARINEALKTYDDQHDQFRKALVRPAQWGDLFKKHATAAEDLAALEARRLQRQGELLRIKEMRAVAPLLRTLDQAAALLAELYEAPLLSASAEAERVAAETGLAAARHSAGVATADAERQRAALQTLVLDEPVLAAGPAIERLGTLAESVDGQRREAADARVDVQALQAEVATLARQIDAHRPPAEVQQRAPAPSAKAEYEEKLRHAERAQQAVEQHRVAMARLTTDGSEPVLPPLPPPEARTALRSAQVQVTRSETLLQRLEALPAEIKAAQRALAAALAAIGLAEEAAVQPVRPLLDAEIDAARAGTDENRTRRAAIAQRIGQIDKALADAIAQREALLAAGAVPTAQDVQAARAHREQGWRLVRGTYIEATHPPTQAYAAGRPLAQAYEDAVQQADRLVDDLARDTARVEKWQASLREIQKLHDDRGALVQEDVQMKDAAAAQAGIWWRRLEAAHLPALGPGELREWQARLATARQAIEALHGKRDEHEAAQAAAQALAATLRAAIAATGMAASPAPEAPLRTLAALATEIEDETRQREKTQNTAAGKRQERELQRRQGAVREQELGTELQAAQAALAPVWTRLLLPAEATLAVARARLGEFEALLAAKSRLDAAATRLARAELALAALAQQAGDLAQALAEPAEADVRRLIDRLGARLHAAKTTRQARVLAEQALAQATTSQREHEDRAAGHAAELAALCRAAGVELPASLPQAEDRSRRKRQAQAELDQARAQLAQASRHPVQDLRAWMEGQDAARMDADEDRCTRELAELEMQLRAAREHEEATRRALEAIDSDDTAAAAREGMERAAAGVRAAMGPWIRSRLAHGLLAEALKRFRDRAQGPMLQAASAHFGHMTGGEFVRLLSDDSGAHPVLLAQRAGGSRIGVEAMSEGTRDQLYLALRLAALGIRRAAGVDLPVILDDVLMTSDDGRAGRMLQALAEFSRGGQVMAFTHHGHLVEVGRAVGEGLGVVRI